MHKAFYDVIEEARCGIVNFVEDSDERIIRIAFNLVEKGTLNNMPNLYIKNKTKFYEILEEYILTALEFYDLEENYNNIKLLMTYLFVNITNTEMNCLEDYLMKYVSFIKNDKLNYKMGVKNTSIGNLNYCVTKQSYKQETPYCFKAYFEENDSKYALPRISFGIKDGICYIYAIQNKDSKINIDPKYNLKVKDSLRTINSGISKYRNVTPSFIVVLSLFVSFLKENNITKINVVTPLPIRQGNRELTSEYKIKFYSMKGNLSGEEIEKLKKEITDKKINDDFNSTVKFVNCFNRLKLHFDNLFLSNLDSNITLDIIDLITKNQFLTEIVKERKR